MHELDRIEEALANRSINHTRFEHFTVDTLSEVFPGLSAIPGGTDSGRDADIHGQATPPIRLVVTTARTLRGIRENLRRGLRSMEAHDVPFDRVVLANLGLLSGTQRSKLRSAALEHGAYVEVIYDRRFFASRLRRDGEWRSDLLGLSGEPISVSRVPPSLAESPWAHLPLVGRDADMDMIQSCEGHVIISGPPGVGKTRLAGALRDAVFIDVDAAEARLSDDVRWVSPHAVVLDDAGTGLTQLRRLVRLQRAEPDILDYRIVAVCWPDEIDDVQVCLPNATVVNLQLLERHDINAILELMGISAAAARREILDQAEGRPGWAVALGDLLLTSGDATSLLTGRALLGTVETYLRRADLPSVSIDMLTLIACLGFVTQGELDQLAAELGTERLSLVANLRSVATTGIVDVSRDQHDEHGEPIRTYTVRPPMLASALVVGQLFEQPVPSFDLDHLATNWPNRSVHIAHAVVESSRLGSRSARPSAERFFTAVVESPDVGGRQKLSLADAFSRLDHAAGQQILDMARSEFDALVDQTDFDPYDVQPLVDLASVVARWHLISDAVVLLLDAAAHDTRETSPHPGHPLRQLADLVGEFHPEYAISFAHRRLVAETADSWISSRAASREHWRVYGQVLASVLSFELGAGFTAPEDPRVFQMTAALLPPELMDAVFDELWPPIRNHLSGGHPIAIGEAISSGADWLRTGAGFGGAFGLSPSDQQSSKAKALGEALLRELEPIAAAYPGTAAHLRGTASQFGYEIGLEPTAVERAFFSRVDPSDDLDGTVQRLRSAIADIVGEWLDEPTSVVLGRLTELRDEVLIAGVRWPDRIEMACSAIADTAADLVVWVEGALEEDLFPAAGPFLAAPVARGENVPLELWERCLTNAGSRWVAMHAALTNDVPDAVLRLVVANLAASDYRLLETLLIRGELPPDRIEELLSDTSGPARGAVAAAMFESAHNNPDWTPGVFEDQWLDAIQLIDFPATDGFNDYHESALFEYMARVYPSELTGLISHSLSAARDGDVYGVISHGAWDRLYLLPTEDKNRLWRESLQRPALRWILGQHLLGTDVSWLEQLFETNDISVDEALSLYNGLGPHPDIEDLARVLVPRGADPARVANLARWGFQSGAESDRYASLTATFEQLSGSDDQAVAEVGRAGVAMYSAAAADARQKERTKRVRGDL